MSKPGKAALKACFDRRHLYRSLPLRDKREVGEQPASRLHSG